MTQTAFRFCIKALGLSLAATSASAEQLAMDQVHWNYTGDHFRCELELPLQKFGLLRFRQPAGGPLTLNYVAPSASPAAVSVATITAPWQQSLRSQATALEQQQTGFVLAPETSRALMQALDNGFWTALNIDGLELRVPTVRWQPVARQFRDCRQQLSPLSIGQARDQELFYQSGQRALTEPQLQQLEQLAHYIQYDDSIRKLLIDGHTDNTGSRLGNLQISRERAADVAAALRSAGVPADLIEQRAHGDRYPSANNSTAEGRDQNRKVTIRVIRQDTGETS